MVKLRRRKQIYKTVDKIHQIFADSEGITLKEYKRRKKIRDASSKEYEKTHWVQDLTHAQKYFIATQNDKEPYRYMGRPLSRNNTWVINRFKEDNANYKAFVKSRKIIKDFTKPLEPLKKLQKEYQELGKKLRMNMPNPFDVSGIMSVPTQEGLIKVKGLLHDSNEANKVEKSHGLNTLMKKHNMKSPIEIADHYLKTFNEPSKADYVADSFQNSIALCNAVGVSPHALFIELCRHIKVSKKMYKEQKLMAGGVAIEELMNAYDALCKSRQSKTTIKFFYDSKRRKDWSIKYGWHWKDYKRFNEDFPRWQRIFSARANKVDSDIDTMINLENESLRGK